MPTYITCNMQTTVQDKFFLTNDNKKLKKCHVHTTFICGAQVANSRSQFRNVESGATTKCGEMRSPKRDAKKAILCMVLPTTKQKPKHWQNQVTKMQTWNALSKIQNRSKQDLPRPISSASITCVCLDQEKRKKFSPSS